MHFGLDSRRQCLQDSAGRPLTHSGRGSDLSCTASVDSTLTGRTAYLRAALDNGLPVGPGWLQYQRATLRGEVLQPLLRGLTAWASLRGAESLGLHNLPLDSV